MPHRNITGQRLFVDAPLAAGSVVETERAQTNYLLSVLRLREGSRISLFNGRDGEWSAAVIPEGRKSANLEIIEQTRPQTLAPDLQYLLAPLKQARMEYVVQKAVEMGAGVIQPVITRFTQNRKLNLEKMHSYVVDAAEQCGALCVPEMREAVELETALAGFDAERTLIFCDEAEDNQSPLGKLEDLHGKKLAVLIGPEGGFSQDERSMLHNQTFVRSIALGPRTLRADTAAVAALALVQAVAGDWHGEQ